MYTNEKRNIFIQIFNPNKFGSIGRNLFRLSFWIKKLRFKLLYIWK